MIQPASLEELASLVEKAGKKVFLYSNGPRSVYGFGQTLGCLRNS